MVLLDKNVKTSSAQEYVNRCLAPVGSHQRHEKGKGLRSLILSLAAVLLAAGCAAVGPDYVAPDMPVPAAWQEDSVAGAKTPAPDPSPP